MRSVLQTFDHWTIVRPAQLKTSRLAYATHDCAVPAMLADHVPRPLDWWCPPNGLKMSRKPIRPIPTYQVATAAAIPEGMMAAYPNPQARMLVGSIFELGS
jgi:hypothetical protein